MNKKESLITSIAFVILFQSKQEFYSFKETIDKCKYEREINKQDHEWIREENEEIISIKIDKSSEINFHFCQKDLSIYIWFMNKFPTKEEINYLHNLIEKLFKKIGEKFMLKNQTNGEIIKKEEFDSLTKLLIKIADNEKLRNQKLSLEEVDDE